MAKMMGRAGWWGQQDNLPTTGSIRMREKKDWKKDVHND
jgi:hypothetical protein